mgnify:CR=1 FL=1
MSFIEININDAIEPSIVEEGEYAVRIEDAEVKVGQSGKKYIGLRLSILNEDNVKQVNEVLMLPDAADDESTKNRRLLALKRMCTCFDYEPQGGIDTAELIGREGRVFLKIEDSEQYGKSNRVRRYVAA